MIRRRILWGIFLLLAFLLCFFENNTGTRIVALGTVLLPLPSILLSGIARKQIHLRMDIPDRVTSPDVIQGHITLTAPVWLIGTSVRTTITGTHSLLMRQWHWEADLSSRRGYDLEATEIPCGAVEFTLDRTEISDIFGLWSFPVRCCLRTLCLVTPVTFPVKLEAASPVREYPDESPASFPERGQDLFEMSGQRLYIPGDPIRSIHWKLSEKMDRLLIREGEQQREPCILLCLDAIFFDEEKDSERDELISALASVSEYLQGTGIQQGIGLRGRFQSRVCSQEERLLAMDRLLLGEFLPDSPLPHTDDPEGFTEVWLFTDHPGNEPDPDWAGLPVLRICSNADDLSGNAVLLNRMNPVLCLNPVGTGL